ncbi:MAG: formate/nitrite transporter family protein, partial [Myxococcota bacterium]
MVKATANLVPHGGSGWHVPRRSGGMAVSLPSRVTPSFGPSADAPTSPPTSKHRSSAHSLFEAVRHEGEAELARPLKSLWWSGVAAGLAMATSLLGEAIVERSLPAHASYAASLSAVGYSLGFLIVVLGHLQLFTENTITTLLPVLRRRTWSCVASMLRLWSVVFLANLVGAGLAGWTLSSGTVGPSLLATMEHIAERATAADFGTNFLRAIPAGFMVAAIVWLTRLEKPTRFWVIVVLTWAIAAGGFSHVIVGSVEVFLL